MMATPRVLNVRTAGRPAGAIYVGRGRGSIWGNPFRIGVDGTRDEVIAAYEGWLDQRPELLARLGELRGHDLLCWCAPEPCHAEVLVRRANSGTVA